ncbi:glycoside-pentoside-hexuronide (GPH):cation symporter [Pseudomonas sp. MAFF 302046]|uniref:Glycoside-pentoside-hexuronide (GPH):cation symporter n=1 Tax=Pseudomonas morbosilactucae TaxID=2938197 RepID=A0ABT0JGK9_9PSED|nr:glycoside-pentoside-hexuronide (GPH):cation symporter [Pseudomonas morbosilactucae]MCK9815058.1 glycoside-pentoside-hexuronide (GPH):cation symporter [Pseudomonas morbosilactucae]
MTTPTARITESYVVLGAKEKIGYGLGDLACNLSFGFVSLFLLYFYTDIYGLSAAEASLIFVIARVIDALFNILVGYAVDRTHSRHGKLRPYLLYGALPLAGLSILCFSAWNIELKFTYALISYTLYCLAYTTVNTPYSALTNRMTQHEGSRASLSVYRFVLAVIGYLIVATSAERLVALFTEPRDGYVFAVSLFALLATFCLIACFGMTRERVDTRQDRPSPSLRDMLRAVFDNLPLIHLSLFTLFFYIAYTLWMAIAVYFIKYVIGDEGFSPLFFALQTAAYILGTVLSQTLIARLGKKKMTLGVLLLGIGGLVIQYIFASHNLPLTMVCIGLYSITLGAGFVAMWSMIADTVEYAEWKNGHRAEGAIYGFFNFVTKIAMALGGGLAGLLLQLSGYSAAQVDAQAINAITLMMTLVPALMFALGFVFVLFYPLDEQSYRNLLQRIEQRKQTALAP